MDALFLQILQWTNHLSGSEAVVLVASFTVGLTFVAGVIVKRREARRERIYFSFPVDQDYTHRRRNSGPKIYVGR